MKSSYEGARHTENLMTIEMHIKQDLIQIRNKQFPISLINQLLFLL
jgi:hypothetical protein